MNNNYSMPQPGAPLDASTQAQAQAAYYYSQQMQQYYQQQAAAAAAAVQQAAAAQGQNTSQGQPQQQQGAGSAPVAQPGAPNQQGPTGTGSATFVSNTAPFQTYASYLPQNQGSTPSSNFVPAAQAASYGPGQTASAYVPPLQQQQGQGTPQTTPVYGTQQQPPGIQGTPQQQMPSAEEWSKWAAAYAQQQAAAAVAYTQQVLSSYGQLPQQQSMAQQTGNSYDPSSYQHYDQSAMGAVSMETPSATISGAPQVYQNMGPTHMYPGAQMATGGGPDSVSGSTPRQIGPQFPTKSNYNAKPRGGGLLNRPTTPTGTRPQTRPPGAPGFGGRGRGGYPLLGGRPTFQSMGMTGAGAGTGGFPRPRGSNRGSWSSPTSYGPNPNYGYQYGAGYGGFDPYGYAVAAPYMGGSGPRPKRGGPNIYGNRMPLSEDGGPAPSDMFFPYYGIAELPSVEEEEPDPKKLKVEETNIGDWKPVENSNQDKNGDGYGLKEDDPVAIPEDMLQPDFCKLCLQKLDGDSWAAHYDSGDHLIKSNEYVQKVREERAEQRKIMEEAGVWQMPPKKRQYSFINKKFKFTCFLCKMFFETQETVNSHVTEETHRKKVVDCQNATIFNGPFTGGKSKGKNSAGPRPPQLKLSRGANIEDLYCEICNKIMNSPNQLEEHFNSKKHKDKEQHLFGGQKTSKNENQIQNQIQNVEIQIGAEPMTPVSKADQSKTVQEATNQSVTAEGGVEPESED